MKNKPGEERLTKQTVSVEFQDGKIKAHFLSDNVQRWYFFIVLTGKSALVINSKNTCEALFKRISKFSSPGNQRYGSDTDFHNKILF